MGKLIGDAHQVSGYGFSSTYLGNKAQQDLNLRQNPKKEVGKGRFLPDTS